MHSYRAYLIGSDGHIIRRIDLDCADDESAARRARQLVEIHAVELWDGARKVAVFNPDPKRPARNGGLLSELLVGYDQPKEANMANDQNKPNQGGQQNQNNPGNPGGAQPGQTPGQKPGQQNQDPNHKPGQQNQDPKQGGPGGGQQQGGQNR